MPCIIRLKCFIRTAVDTEKEGVDKEGVACAGVFSTVLSVWNCSPDISECFTPQRSAGICHPISIALCSQRVWLHRTG